MPGSNSTFANTDTSGATTLAPARDAAEREEAANQANGPGGQKYPEAAGKAEFPGAHSAGGYAGGPTSAKQETSSGDSIYQTSGSGSTGGSGSAGGSDPTGGSDLSGRNASTGGSGSAIDTGSTGGNSDSSNQKPSTFTAPTAPGYIASVVSNPGKSGKPHGKNITEGRFDVDDSNNASFNSEIGSENDPGRKAEHDFQTQAQSASGGTGPRQYGKEGNAGEGGYGVLDSDQSL